MANDLVPLYNAALQGLGLAYMPKLLVEADLAAGRLVQVLAEECTLWAGMSLVYPESRQRPAKSQAFIEHTLAYFKDLSNPERARIL